jgi:hypothetical protein
MTEFANMPDTEYKARDLFGIDTDMVVMGYKERTSHVPPIDPDYLFDRNTTLAILAGFAYNRAITAPANPPISSRSRRALTGRSFASISTAM